jgi:replicative DNA helicase
MITGVPTGLTDLDRLTGGLQRSDLITLAARPAVGKSGLAVSIAYNAAMKHNKNIAIFSLEMSKEQLFQRIVAMDARVNQTKLRNGDIDDEDWERIIESLGRLNIPIYIDDTPAITCAEMKSKLRQMAASGYKPDLVVIDYLQLMKTPGSKRTDNRVQEVSEISRDLKILARELDIPVLALAQLSREVEKRQVKIPQLSDLRESGSIEQDSDIVMFIYRDEVYNPETERPNQADIIIAKHRNGPVGEVAVYFDKKYTRFANLEIEAQEVF